MEIDRELLRDIAQAASSEGRMPPRVALRALVSLAGSTVPLSCTAHAQSAEESTTWRIVALTQTDLLVVEATAPISEWSFDRDESERTEPATLSAAYAIPRAAVTRIDVTETQPADDWGADSLDAWTTLWKVVAGDLEVSLPAGTRRSREASDGLVLALRALPDV